MKRGVTCMLYYAVKVVASFYKVQYEHIKLRSSVVCIRVCFKCFGGIFVCPMHCILHSSTGHNIKSLACPVSGVRCPVAMSDVRCPVRV